MSYPNSFRSKALVLGVKLLFKRYILTLAIISAIGCTSLEASERWTEKWDAQFGYRYSFPESLFASVEGDGKLGFHYFVANPVLSFSSVPGIIEMMGLQNISSVG